MVRQPLTRPELERGRRLGELLRRARGNDSLGRVAGDAGISVETLRKIETGRIPTPTFFTVAALARCLGLTLDEISERCEPAGEELAEHATATAAGGSRLGE